MEDIKEFAKECFGCVNKPCSGGCPMRTNIPEFINQIKNDNLEEAYKILHSNNIFSHICSTVCPQELQCEGNCIRRFKFTPTKIGKLEKYVNEVALEKGYEIELTKKARNGKKVAIIGCGPASIECGYELLKEGFDVDYFEKENELGGILTYGIPDFRLDKNIVNKIVEKIQKLGANIYLNKEFGKDIMLECLQEKYDYVFLGIGAQTPSIYDLGAESKSVYDSDTFLKMYNRNEKVELGKVVVIGGGNVAMDSARAANKMGATEVKILYRRDRAHMPAREVELDEALEEGVIFKELTRVVSANENDKKIVSVNCVPTEIVDNKAVDKEGGESFTEEANTIIFAIGLKPTKSLLEDQGLKLNDWGYLEIDENGKTNIENVYAGGDVCDSKSYVCRAVAAGKKAAMDIISKNV